MGLDIVQHSTDFTVACTQHRIIYINIKLYRLIECVAVCAPTSFRLKIRDAMHDDMVKEQGLVVDFMWPERRPAKYCTYLYIYTAL